MISTLKQFFVNITFNISRLLLQRRGINDLSESSSAKEFSFTYLIYEVVAADFLLHFLILSQLANFFNFDISLNPTIVKR